MRKSIIYLAICFCFVSCQATKEEQPAVFLTVLGIAQDAGYPQMACTKACCSDLWERGIKGAKVSCLGLVDKTSERSFIIDATPDLPYQMEALASTCPNCGELPDGVLLTHAHMGHYTGLMYLGRESVGAHQIPVYMMPRMKTYLETNGPWSQLFTLQNIQAVDLVAEEVSSLSQDLSVVPFLVPHRDEFSETVGYKIYGPNKKALFIPDIDKWERWDKSLEEEIAQVDYAFLDATFYQNGEIPGRDMSEISHPFVEETIDLLSKLADNEKQKVFFIHLNHTNPLLTKGEALDSLNDLGFQMAEEGMIFGL